MFYSISSAKYPLIYSSSGMLINQDHFLHPDRTIDTYVLILVQEGTLHIAMDDTEYQVTPNHFVILFPGIRHYGTRPSKGRISYYWLHFSIQDPFKKIIQIRNGFSLQKELGICEGWDDMNYVLPTCGSLYDNRKPEIIFQILLDTAKRDHYAVTWRCHYLVSELVLEVVHDAVLRQSERQDHYPNTIIRVLEYIRTHYAEPISTRSIAQEFGYNPVYLERLFQKSMGNSITGYINQTRIDASRNLLLNSIRSLDSISATCGFSDTKYYMRVFKKLTGMTPTQYKKSLSQKKINTK